jgi:hypothetical protein
MIDPKKITDFHRTEYELQEFLLFCIFVAGKTAKIIAPKLDGFLEDKTQLPFDYLESMGHEGFKAHLRKHKIGKYGLLDSGLWALVRFKPDLRNMSFNSLESYLGIGPKTSRFFVLHSRPGIKTVVLDTHILKDVRKRGINAPVSTPQGRKYEDISRQYVRLLEADGVTDFAEFDLNKWKEYAK